MHCNVKFLFITSKENLLDKGEGSEVGKPVGHIRKSYESCVLYLPSTPEESLLLIIQIFGSRGVTSEGYSFFISWVIGLGDYLCQLLKHDKLETNLHY